ncbi:MAG: hypothetical protein Kow006_04650 [Gammaproteobacteria bacterium]
MTGQSASRDKKGERPVWQRWYWEHRIRDEEDWRRHVDYIHYNPVRHGYVASAGGWPHGSFQRAVLRGWYEPDWGCEEPDHIVGMELD